MFIPDSSSYNFRDFINVGNQTFKLLTLKVTVNYCPNIHRFIFRGIIYSKLSLYSCFEININHCFGSNLKKHIRKCENIAIRNMRKLIKLRLLFGFNKSHNNFRLWILKRKCNSGRWQKLMSCLNKQPVNC